MSNELKELRNSLIIVSPIWIIIGILIVFYLK